MNNDKMKEQTGGRPDPSDLVAFAEWETSIFERPSAQSSQRLIYEIKRLQAALSQSEPAQVRRCKGRNCGCTDGVSHSDDCKDDYAIASKKKEILIYCGNKYPIMRYRGYTNQTLHASATDEEKLAWEYGNSIRI